MAKRKKPVAPKNSDAKVVGIILALFSLGVIVFFMMSKKKEPHQPPQEVQQESFQQQTVHKEIIRKIAHRQRLLSNNEGSDAYIPNTKPVESISPESILPVPIQRIPGSGGKIALIIDDWGQTTSNCKYLKEIPEPLAVSILPGLRHTKDVAACAKVNHKLTMLHLPLEALYNNDFYPPDYIIKTSMKPELAAKIVDDDLNQLPAIEGVNNHMGSKATGDRSLMRLIFKKVKSRGLFFVDSMTAHNSVCTALADEMRLPFGKRDVFLDNINTKQAIIKQLTLLAQRARRRGYAVAIGHDRHLTMQVIKDEIPLLESQGFQFVSIKELLRNK